MIPSVLTKQDEEANPNGSDAPEGLESVERYLTMKIDARSVMILETLTAVPNATDDSDLVSH